MGWKANPIDAERGSEFAFYGVKKKFQKELERLKKVPGLDEHERILLARSLSATPQERWDMHENFLRSLGLLKHSDRKAFGYK